MAGDSWLAEPTPQPMHTRELSGLSVRGKALELCIGRPHQRTPAVELHSRSVVQSPGKEDGGKLKPFVAIQRVQLPPGKGAARQPEASLARGRRRTSRSVDSGCQSPGLSLEIKPRWSLRCRESGGSIARTAKGEVVSIRPGSESQAEAWDGLPGNTRDPARVHDAEEPDRRDTG